MEQIERIKTMEEHLNKASQAVKTLNDALDLYTDAMESIEIIDDYLVSDECSGPVPRSAQHRKGLKYRSR